VKLLNNWPYKVKLISIYISTTIVGVVLILSAIFNASIELEARHKSENMYEIFTLQASTFDITQNGRVDINKLHLLARKLTSKTYQSFIVSKNSKPQQIHMKKCGIDISSQFINQNSAQKQYGYETVDGCTFSWALISLQQSQHKLAVLYQFSAHTYYELYNSHSNHLVIPIIFFIWITVWGSLILGNLVSRLKNQKEKVEHMAMHDALTGLPNRNYFTSKIKVLLSNSKIENKTFVLALIDLNKFKSVNDKLGHNYGDEVLKQVALRFKKESREQDIIARLGGDEFILLLPDTTLKTSQPIIERIHSAIVEDYSVLGKTIKIGASIGVSYFPEHDTEYMELLHKADLAMYVAKESGGGIKVFAS